MTKIKLFFLIAFLAVNVNASIFSAFHDWGSKIAGLFRHENSAKEREEQERRGEKNEREDASPAFTPATRGEREFFRAIHLAHSDTSSIPRTITIMPTTPLEFGMLQDVMTKATRFLGHHWGQAQLVIRPRPSMDHLQEDFGQF